MIIDFEHHYTPYEIWKQRGGKKGEVVRIFSPEGKEIRPLYDVDYDIPRHLKVMDMAGIDMAVLAKSLDTFEEAKIYNDSCAEAVKTYPKRLVGFACGLPLGGKRALDEVERAVKDLGLKGVTIRPQIEGKPLDSREMWPFYEKISKLDVPIFVHVSLAAQGFNACDAPYDLNRTIVREFDLILATSRICLGGVLETFPDLKFIIAHFGGGISSMKERLDRYVSYWKEKFWNGKPLIREPYAERFNEHFNKLYFNMAGREIGVCTVKCALTNISPKRLLFATDYPPNFVDDPEGMKAYIQAIRNLDLDKESIDGMLGMNGAQLLRL